MIRWAISCTLYTVQCTVHMHFFSLQYQQVNATQAMIYAHLCDLNQTICFQRAGQQIEI